MYMCVYVYTHVYVQVCKCEHVSVHKCVHIPLVDQQSEQHGILQV